MQRRFISIGELASMSRFQVKHSRRGEL
jgi:hypothetical protein